MTGDTMLETLQADVVAVLKNCPDLADANVMAEDDGDLEKKVLRKLGTLTTGETGKPGLVCVVALPEVTEAESNLPGPPVSVTIDIRIIEQPTINRGTAGTGIRSSVGALRVLGALHLRSMGHCALYAGADAVKPVQVEGGYMRHDVKLSMRYGGIQPPEKPAGVGAVYDDQAGTLTLSCGTAGAAIWYTTDGSYPTPDNGTLYTVPITTSQTRGNVVVGGDAVVDGDWPLAGTILLFAAVDGDTVVWSTDGLPDPSEGDWLGLYFTPYQTGTLAATRGPEAIDAGSWTADPVYDTPETTAEWSGSGAVAGYPTFTELPPVSLSLVRAVAYVSGSVPSDLTSITITE
jgi:hypothetical protein